MSLMPTVILFSLCLLITACINGGNDTVSSGSTATPAPSPAPPVPISFDLVVAKTGSGTIISSPGGIACGTTCSNSYVGNTDVALTAAPASGYTFSGWGGACVGTSTNCELSMTVNRSVSAMFTAVGDEVGTVTVSWTAPSKRTSGTPMPLSELAGYKIYYGTSLGNYPGIIDISDNTSTTYTLKGLVSKTSYYFVVTSYDVLGKEGAHSNVVVRTPTP